VYKTAFYTFYLPIACALILAGEKRPAVFAEAESICKVMGEYFQVQDDYLDAYAPPEVLGKVGTDIQDFKCSWLAVKCLQLATPAQRKVFEDNYGRKDDANVAAVKALYRELDLEKVFEQYEEDSVKQINALIDNVKDVTPTIYKDLLAKVYKRKK
jgi:farnesyl diphosphate synthase